MPEKIDIYQAMADLKRGHTPFAIATVIETRGASSGKPGDKALFDSGGFRLAGWIGGGCVESLSGEAAQKAIAESAIQTIHINLQEENLLMSVPCGGEMTVMVEPVHPAPNLLIRGAGSVVETLGEMAALVGFRVTVQVPEKEADRHRHAHEVLTDNRGLEQFEPLPEYLVLAAHVPEDNLRAAEALRLNIPYVAVIASRKRSALLQRFLLDQGLDSSNLNRLHAPAGLDLAAKRPEEIALSILAEMVAHRNGGTGDSMRLPQRTTESAKAAG